MVGEAFAEFLFIIFELLILPFFILLFIELPLDILEFIELPEFDILEFIEPLLDIPEFDILEFIEPLLPPEFPPVFIILELVRLLLETLLAISPQAIDPIAVTARTADNTI